MEVLGIGGTAVGKDLLAVPLKYVPPTYVDCESKQYVASIIRLMENGTLHFYHTVLL